MSAIQILVGLIVGFFGFWIPAFMFTAILFKILLPDSFEKWISTRLPLITHCMSFILSCTFIGFIYVDEHTPENIIRHKQESIHKMQIKLRDQLMLISQIQNENKEDIERYSKELQEKKLIHRVTSLENATKDILQLIQLIQGRDAYLSRLTEVKRVTENGLDEIIGLNRELIFVRRELEGIRRMEKVIVGGKSLGNNIEEVLKKYDIYSKPLSISRSELQYKSPEVIWQQYAR